MHTSPTKISSSYKESAPAHPEGSRSGSGLGVGRRNYQFPSFQE